MRADTKLSRALRFMRWTEGEDVTTMMLIRVGAAVAGLLLATGLSAQTPPSPTPGTAPSATTGRPPAGGVVGRAPLPRNRIPPRTFEQCTREAQARRYRGVERRHFVTRCQLGVRRLFRRRGAGQPTAANPPAPAPATR